MKVTKSTKSQLLCVFAVLFFAITLSVLFAVPARAADAKAIGWVFNCDGYGPYNTTDTLKVEAGQTFYAGDLFGQLMSGDGSYAFTSGSDLSITYKSSNTSVATVGKSSGYVKALKKGTTKITAKYKGVTYTLTLKVVNAGTIGTTGKFATLAKTSKALAKYYDVKITSKNFTTIMKKVIAFYNAELEWNEKYDFNYGVLTSYTTGASTGKLAIPYYQRAYSVYTAMYSYAENKSVLQNLKLSSIKASAGGTTITINLKKAVTAQQVYIIQMLYGYGKKWSTSPSSATFEANQVSRSTSVTDVEYSGYPIYYGVCKVKKNSKVLTITVYKEYGSTKKVKLSSDFEYIVNLGYKSISTTVVPK
ncbi:MAG: Ig-like domain-containing protein [Clostridiales bacterium]|nr:Ig-like domain-containing protein [Clostridiales bacterium]